MSAPPIFVVYGASGLTGTLVATALHAHDATLVLIGRDRARLTALRAQLGGRPTVAVAEAHDRAALDRAFAGARVVVACAGPFPQVGGAVAAAAIAAGAHYVDVAGEQAFVRLLHEEHDAAARRRGLVVVPGMGVGAIGDWAARWAAQVVLGGDAATDPPAASGDDDERGRIGEGAPLDELAIGHAVDGFAPAPGTSRSLIDTLGAPGVVWRAERWDPTRPAARGRELDFGPLGRRAARSFPAAEIIMLPNHVAARAIDAFFALPDDPWARGLAPLAPLAGLLAPFASLMKPVLATLVDPTRVPDAAARALARFAIVAQARRGGASAQVLVTGVDLYALVARLASDAARALAAGAGGLPGVRAPAQAFAARAALTTLAHDGVVTIATSFARREAMVERSDARSP